MSDSTLKNVGAFFHDVAQGASNSAASTVSTPVDALAWLLRKGGVPVGQRPFGGSEWMAHQGLTREPKGQAGKMVGETAGALLPAVAASKASQIAGMFNKAQANVAVPRSLGSERGALVFAPHKPDPQKLNMVVREMESLGPPTIRAVWDGEKYLAVEGAHRLAAAKRLGMTPIFDEVAERSWLTGHDLQELPEKTSVLRAMRYLYDDPKVFYNFD